MSSSSLSETQESKEIGCLLSFGVFLAPYLFAWILFAGEKYSPKAKNYALAWLGSFVLVYSAIFFGVLLDDSGALRMEGLDSYSIKSNIGR